MYICAQRVIRPGGEAQGINSYYYVHGPSDWQGRPPPEFLPQVNPGELADSLVEVDPPGNRVRSYLDIVAPDHTPLGHLVHAARGVGVVPALPVTWVQGNVWCSFGAERALAVQWRQELQRLLARVAMLARRQLPA